MDSEPAHRLADDVDNTFNVFVHNLQGSVYRFAHRWGGKYPGRVRQGTSRHPGQHVQQS